jgi:chitodextrinase
MMAADPPTLACTAKSGQPCWSDLSVIEPDELQPEQQTWLTSYIQRFHDALHAANASNPTTGYPAYIDVDSFINRIIHNELAKEPDAYIRSTHFYKDRGGKLVAGPLWDYDLGFACYTGFGGGGGSAVSGWQYQPGGGMSSTTDWFVKLMSDSTFVSQLKARWQALRKGIMSDAQLTARVNTLTAPLANAAARNFQRWPILNTATVGGFGTQTTQTWDQQLQILRDFLTQRAAWIDQTANWGGGGQPVCTSVPQTPSGLTASAVSSSQISLAWSTVAAPANCTVTYSVFRNGSQVASNLTSGSFTDTGLAASTAYQYYVRAVDAAGSSANSATVSATTKANGGTGGCTCPAGCASATTISVPFSKDGAGEFCWVATSLGAYISSWNLTNLNVNGTDFTNKWASSSNLPAKIDGNYYLYYNGSYAWSHFEVK